MSRKLGQIIAIRENTWMIRIPMGCDPQTKQRSYTTAPFMARSARRRSS